MKINKFVLFLFGSLFFLNNLSFAGTWQKVANQYQIFSLEKSSVVRFGNKDKWTYKTLPVGKSYCFLNPDPAPGVFKTCEVEVTPPVENTYYFSSCDSGSSNGCVVGDNNKDGKTPATAKKDFVGFSFSNLPAGTQVLLAQGGSWITSNALRLENSQANKNQKITIASYPVVNGSNAKPKYQFTGTGDAFAWFCSGCGNYNIKDIDFSLTQNNSTAFSTWGQVFNMEWSNISITGGGTAIYIAATTPHSDNISIRSSKIENSHGIAVLAGADNFRVENNHFKNNSLSQSDRDHHLYLSCKETLSAEGSDAKGCIDNLVKNNVFEDTSFVGAGVMVVQHDLFSNLVIEGNLVQNTYGADNDTWGISLTQGNFDHGVEGCKNCVVKNNTIVNLGQIAIDVSQASQTKVLNNTILWTIPYEAQCIRVGVWGGNSTDVKQTDIEVANNTCYMDKPKNESIGVLFDGGGQNQKIKNNLIYFNGTGSYLCNKVLSSASSFIDSNNNACYALQSESFSDLAPLTLSVIRENPLLVSKPTVITPFVKLQPNSPAIGKGVQ